MLINWLLKSTKGEILNIDINKQPYQASRIAQNVCLSIQTYKIFFNTQTSENEYFTKTKPFLSHFLLNFQKTHKKSKQLS